MFKYSGGSEVAGVFMDDMHMEKCSVVFSNTGIFLVPRKFDVLESMSARWAAQLIRTEHLVQNGKVPGWDLALMKLLPMAALPTWEDVGPHLSVVSCPKTGRPTENNEGKVDDLEVAQNTYKSNKNPVELLVPLCEVELSGESGEFFGDLAFLLGSATNDDGTNGPVMLVQKYGDGVRAKVNEVRNRCRLGPFLHYTQCT